MSVGAYRMFNYPIRKRRNPLSTPLALFQSKKWNKQVIETWHLCFCSFFYLTFLILVPNNIHADDWLTMLKKGSNVSCVTEEKEPHIRHYFIEPCFLGGVRFSYLMMYEIKQGYAVKTFSTCQYKMHDFFIEIDGIVQKCYHNENQCDCFNNRHINYICKGHPFKK